MERPIAYAVAPCTVRHLRRNHRPMRSIARLILLLGTAASTALAAPPQAHPLPDFGEPADRALSPAEEVRIGREIVSQLYGHGIVLEDAEIDQYLNTTGMRLAMQVPSRPDRMQFFMVRDRRINAFALPGGFIGINAGLMIAAETESELAGVLGHEIAHVTQRHIARAIDGTQATTMAAWLGVIAAILIGSAAPDVVLAALSLGQTIAWQNQVNYTRAHELEADRLGIRILAEAGYDPQGMVDFFVRLEQQSRLYGSGLPEILRTHPLETTRIAEAQTRAREYPRRPVTDSDSFRLMRARTRVLSAQRPGEALDAFSARLDAGSDDWADRYGMALARMALGQAQEAARLIAELPAERRAHPSVRILSARATAASDPEAAIAELEAAVREHPNHTALRLALADLLLGAGRSRDARQLLLGHDPAPGTEAALHRMLARIAEADGDHAEAAWQLSHYHMAHGDARSALRALDAALRLPGLDAQTRARLTARRRAIRASLPDDFRLEQPAPQRR